MPGNLFPQPIVGKGSWFGNAPGGWTDAMNGSATASGKPTSVPGIALPSRSTLGQMFQVTAPNGQTYSLPQIDVGPAARTGRSVDISAGAAAQMGYTPKNFPTDSQFKITPVNTQGGFGVTPGRQPDLAHVNPLLVQAVKQGASALPPGYTVEVNEGFNPNGHVAGSQHHIPGMGALDVQIAGPNGVVPNKGADTTGLYTQLAKGTYNAAQNLGIADKLAWGGRFGTVTGGSTPDLMHFDLGGDRGHFGPPLAQRFGTQLASNSPSIPAGQNINGTPWQFPAMRQATPFDTADAKPGVPSGLPSANPTNIPFPPAFDSIPQATNPAQLALNPAGVKVNPFGAAGPAMAPATPLPGAPPPIAPPPTAPIQIASAAPSLPAATPTIPPAMPQAGGVLGGGMNPLGLLGGLAGLGQALGNNQAPPPPNPAPLLPPVHPQVDMSSLLAFLQKSQPGGLGGPGGGLSGWSFT